VLAMLRCLSLQLKSICKSLLVGSYKVRQVLDSSVSTLCPATLLWPQSQSRTFPGAVVPHYENSEASYLYEDCSIFSVHDSRWADNCMKDSRVDMCGGPRRTAMRKV
jgi:hypothetical protein